MRARDEREPRHGERAERDDQHEQGDEHADGLDDRDRGNGLRVEVAADGDLRAVGQRGLEVGADLLEVRLRLGRDIRRLSFELQADDRRAVVVRDQPRDELVERIGHREDAVEVFEVGDRVLDRGRVGLFVDLVALGRDDHELGARAARLRERPAQLLDARLGLGARDRERVVGALHEGRGAAAGDSEQQQPGDEHAPRMAVRPASERIEESGHGASGREFRKCPIRRCIRYIDVS